MREILFRGKAECDNKWVVGSYIPSFEHKWHVQDDVVRSKHVIEFVRDDLILDFAPVKESTVGQFTCLTDKNGKKIFEGDVVHMRTSGLSGRGEIVFKDGAFVIDDKKRKRFYYMYHDAVYRVEGNIYDNPELMEGE